MSESYGSTTTLRTADLQTLATALKEQRTRSIDLVASPSAFESAAGALVIAGADMVMDDDGVTDPNGTYLLTRGAEADLAGKLNIPLKYLRAMHDGDDDRHLPLYDDNVNHWLGEARDRQFMLRLLAGDDGGPGVCRAILSDGYRRIDNFDVLLAALGGLREAGVNPGPGDITADLTENRMHVSVTSREVYALAPEFLKGYRSPFEQGADRHTPDANRGWTIERAREVARAENKGYEPGTEPIVWGGIVISNSETGGGAFTVTPRIVFQICNNGLRLAADAMRKTHLGARLEAGVVAWSEDTQRKNLALVTAQTADAVRTFLNPEYVARKIAELEADAGVKVADAAGTIKAVAKACTFTDDTANDILSHFIMGGQLTAGGVAQAVTSVAQTVSDGDLAAELESVAIDAMAVAARYARV